jgi:hypothetical protein
MRLEDFEPVIKKIARDEARSLNDREDFEQVGRLAAWQALEKHGDDTAFHGVVQMVKWEMKNLSRRLYAHPESSANELFGNVLWGSYEFDDME